MAKILLVEDDTNLSEIYQARMEAEGYIVVAAADGESALALAAKEKPDLILSDVMMPKISGFEMLDILRNTDGLKHTKVIMLTALGQAEDQARAQSLGADRYLVKSQVTLEDIVSAAQELLGDGEQTLPTPAELAAPTITAASNATDSSTLVAEPVQAAPTSTMAATVPAAIPVAQPTSDDPTSEAVAEPIVTVAPMPVSVAPQDEPTTPADPSAPLIEVMSADDNAAAAAEPTPEPIAETTAIQPVVEVPAPTPPVEPQPTITAPDIELPPAPAPEPTPALDETPVPNPDVVSEPTVPAEPADLVPVTPEPTPAAPSPAAEPEPHDAAMPPVTTASIDERVVANAIDKLLAKAPGSADAAISPTSSSEHPHNKVISPIAHAPEPSLQELLAREEAKSGIGSPAAAPAVPVNAPTAPPPATSPVADGDEADAAAILAKAQTTNTNPVKKDEFDPNSISL